ncbi:MAG: hypothetical protein AB7G06_01385 [Bdellovibrionales bacterium]
MARSAHYTQDQLLAASFAMQSDRSRYGAFLFGGGMGWGAFSHLAIIAGVTGGQALIPVVVIGLTGAVVVGRYYGGAEKLKNGQAFDNAASYLNGMKPKDIEQLVQRYKGPIETAMRARTAARDRCNQSKFTWN